MTTSRHLPQAALTADETLASDRLLHELLLELAGDTVVGLDCFRPGSAAADTAQDTAPRCASA